MREYTTPGEVAVAEGRVVPDALFELAQKTPDHPLWMFKDDDGWHTMTAASARSRIIRIAAGLMAAGLEPGDRVCLMSPTRVEWALFDYAIWAAGGVTVPIYETSSADQVNWIVSDSEAVMLVVGNEELAATVKPAVADIASCRQVLVLDSGGEDTLVSGGTEVSESDVTARWEALQPADIATIVYTSGTTGRPKGCVLTHRAVVWETVQVQHAMRVFIRPGNTTLLFLPLAHILARLILITCSGGGMTVALSHDVTGLLDDLAELRPHFLPAVPRVFEKVFNSARQKAEDGGKGKVFAAAEQTAIAYSKAKRSGGVGIALRAKHKVFDVLVYSKLREKLGGRVDYALSGGAALGDRLGHFFDGAGITVLEGYGLTESAAGTTLNKPEFMRIGSVGRPVPGVTVRIADDGEIVIKGPHMFEGYYKNDEATAEVMRDGWFYTGDLGELDNDGYLRITGRKKEIIVTAGGKNVAPAVLEDRLRAHPLVSQAMVVGDDQPFIATLLTVDPEAFEPWKKRHSLKGSLQELLDSDELRAEMQRAIEHANEAVSRAESIREFRILPEDFEVGVELSQKQSVKRHVVSEKYASVIADIYSDDRS